MSEQNKALVRKFYEEVFNRGNVAAIDQLCDTRFVDHTPGPGQSGGGVAGMKEMVAMFRSAFPDMKATVDELVAEKDTVVARITVVMTHKGAFMGAAPTGKKVTMRGLDMIRFKNGKATDVWHYGDEAMVMMQLGVKPPA